ncbi:MAG: hypothetical protein LBQ40_02040 [Clostridiales bacterium]|jgi:hypothetical protein|nr:hypothetical protein [Clostridiales bacterium]
MKHIIKSGLAPLERYGRLGLTKTVAQREDGIRTGGDKGFYEWWYFDSHMDDGTSLVIVFYTKRMMSPEKPPAPYVTVDLDTPDGGHYEERVEIDGVSFSASKEKCDVKVGDCYICGNLDEYEIYFKNPVIEVKARLKSNTPPWRPETGHIFFGDDDEKYFAWLPSVPEGDAEAEITLNGVTARHKGTGYHDHNWGNELMTRLMNHWYWGRAKAGGYQIISSYITGEKKYGYKEYPVFMIAKDGAVLGDDASKLTFEAEDEFIEPKTGKPVHNKLTYDYKDGAVRYKITYERKSSVINYRMVDQLKGIKKFAAKLIGFDGAYHRFSGTVRVEKFDGEGLIEKVEAPALWELMYFGHTPKN